jgi:2-polyprenyl-3-methyl-5-hydroxy-6-metoxy-1,4-benzoquinol methylase
MDAKYWDEKYETEDYVYTKLVNRFVKEYCEPLTPGTAMDVAGGEGRNTVWLASQGWRVENIDFSQKALDKCLKFAEEEGVSGFVDTNCASALEFEPNETPVDLAVIAYLQIPQGQLCTAIERVASHVKPGGHLFGVWHSRDNLEHSFGGPRDPEVLPSPELLRSYLDGLGFEILDCLNRDGQIQTRDGLKPSVTAVLFARKLA